VRYNHQQDFSLQFGEIQIQTIFGNYKKQQYEELSPVLLRGFLSSNVSKINLHISKCPNLAAV
jgi:hypothetical protein